MRFSQVLAFSGLAAAIEAPQGEGNPYVAKFNGFVADTFGAYIPSPNKHDAEAAKETKESDMKMTVFTLNNWKDTLYEPVQPDATEPEEWWVLISGRNKSCYGYCLQVEAAWNESATVLAQRENPPNMGYINCDDQPVLCNMWSAGTGVMWVFDMLPPPADIDIHLKRLNFTTTTSEDILDLVNNGKHKMKLHEGAFHPFHGWVQEYGLALPLGYLFWILNVVPSWAFMLIMSFVSRSFMNRNMTARPNPPQAPAGAAAN
ncbi:uncharacterized protein MKZ38_006389 [Zalerion maritima]|uniref:Peptidyl-tRNA hydrolase n=1 Tax=Zalerion maritima TaxID=339359 RepID=A0AAD5RK25_9PEZI|nr:uncharacterized protein MKZ38_006389 [Zalerion maritima]